jgi:hypothetical protein
VCFLSGLRLEFYGLSISNDIEPSLRSRTGKKPAAFFFRDDRYDADQAKKARATAPDQEWFWGGLQSDVHQKKMLALKAECYKTGDCYEYSNPDHFVELLGRQVEKWLEQVLPTEEELRGSHADAAPHMAALRSHCIHYVDSEQDAHLQKQLLHRQDVGLWRLW